HALNDIGKTNVDLMIGQYNSYVREDNNISIAQTLPFPSVFISQRKLGNALVKSSELQKDVTANELIYEVKQVYYHLLFLEARHTLLKQEDSIFQYFTHATALRYKTG